jgi:hypothetical protein
MQTGYLTQTKLYIKPLFELLEEKKLPYDILNGVFLVCKHVTEKEYNKANTEYLTMSIGIIIYFILGNAPW